MHFPNNPGGPLAAIRHASLLALYRDPPISRFLGNSVPAQQALLLASYTYGHTLTSARHGSGCPPLCPTLTGRVQRDDENDLMALANGWCAFRRREGERPWAQSYCRGYYSPESGTFVGFPNPQANVLGRFLFLQVSPSSMQLKAHTKGYISLFVLRKQWARVICC